MSDFEIELKNEFLIEASQCLSDVEQCFLSLETSSSDPTILEKIFRLAHNLKGSANAVGFEDVAKFAHTLESFMIKLKGDRVAISKSAISLLFECNDRLVKMIEDLKQDLTAKTDCSDLIARLSSEELKPVDITDTQEQEIINIINNVAVAAEQAEKREATETISQDVPVEAEKPVLQIQKNTSVAQGAQNSGGKKSQQTGDDSIRVSLNRLEKLINFVGEMVILQTVLKEQVQSTGLDLVRKVTHQLGKVTKEVQDIAMGLRMVSLKQTFQKMQRIVRDTSQSLNKDVVLELLGEDTEVDKTVLENISDPLVHLIRNAVDHGIETPEERLRKGKPAQGKIILESYHQSGQLIIEVKDDGAGIDAQRLIAKATEKGILNQNSKISERDAINLIFHSGFSTKSVATDISGRGVGMDVVKTNIESLQGEIQVLTELGKGSCFRIKLPLTLAIIDGMVIRCHNERYIIPVVHVRESLRPLEKDIFYISGLGEVLSIRGENIPLYRLNAALAPQAQSQSVTNSTAIVSQSAEKSFAILVDDIVGQQQVVIKQLGPEHANLKGISGSAILGDGRPALILEISELVKRIKPYQQNNLMKSRSA